jgi:hypothetical protein
VAGRLLAVNHLVLAFHCVNHRGALSVEGAVDECPYLANEFIPAIEHQGRYFSVSHARTTSFYDAQSAWHTMMKAQSPRPDGYKDLLKHIKICESAFTRWLTHDRVCTAIRRSYIPLAFGLRHDAEVRHDEIAAGLLTKMLTFPFVGTLAYMSDALPIMCKFSLLTQKSAADVDLEVFSRHLPLLTDVLEHLADNVAPNSHYANLAATLTTLQQDEQDGGPGLEIKNRGVQDANWLEGARKQFHLRLAAHLTSRFPEHELMSSLYVILNADRYPDDRRELHTYLEPHLKRVLDHYCKVNRVKKKKVTVIPNRREAEDSFMPGLSGAGGLAGHIHCHYRGKTKLSSVSDEQPQLTPETMLNNPFYFKTKTKAKEKKDSRDVRVPWAVRDICRAILKNRAECKLF